MSKRVPIEIQVRADALVDAIHQGAVTPRRIRHHTRPLHVVDIGKHWRLIRRCNRNNWEVLSHADYDKLICLSSNNRRD